MSYSNLSNVTSSSTTSATLGSTTSSIFPTLPDTSQISQPREGWQSNFFPFGVVRSVEKSKSDVSTESGVVAVAKDRFKWIHSSWLSTIFVGMSVNHNNKSCIIKVVNPENYSVEAEESRSKVRLVKSLLQFTPSLKKDQQALYLYGEGYVPTVVEKTGTVILKLSNGETRSLGGDNRVLWQAFPFAEENLPKLDPCKRINHHFEGRTSTYYDLSIPKPDDVAEKDKAHEGAGEISSSSSLDTDVSELLQNALASPVATNPKGPSLFSNFKIKGFPHPSWFSFLFLNMPLGFRGEGKKKRVSVQIEGEPFQENEKWVVKILKKDGTTVKVPLDKLVPLFKKGDEILVYMEEGVYVSWIVQPKQKMKLAHARCVA